MPERAAGGGAPFSVLSARHTVAAEETYVTARAQEEYSALRATIRERGTARVWLFVIGVAVWSSLALAVLAVALPPVATLIPLVCLAADFEAVLALHGAAERIGRYLLVFHQDGWEGAVGTFGRPPGALVVDPLFSIVFVLATIINLVPMMVSSPIREEWLIVGTAHAAFIVRIVRARAAAGRQRHVDATRFEELGGRS
jgi:hypothetical protein